MREKGLLGGKGGKHPQFDVDDEEWLGGHVPAARIAALDTVGRSPSSAVRHVIGRMRA